MPIYNFKKMYKTNSIFLSYGSKLRLYWMAALLLFEYQIMSCCQCFGD